MTTLIREMQNIAVPKRKQEALLVARRFMRSVVRIYVVRSVETSSEVGRAPRSRWVQTIFVIFWFHMSKCVILASF